MREPVHRKKTESVSIAPPLLDARQPAVDANTQTTAEQVPEQAVERVVEQEPASLEAAPEGHDFGRMRVVAPSAAAGSPEEPGAPLPDALRQNFQRAVGSDLSGVRVHTGSDAAQAAAAVEAKAFTTGRDIFFGAGLYNQATVDGQRLLAHEVAHTVQQAGASSLGSGMRPANDSLEQSARGAVGSMLVGRPTNVGSSASLMAGQIQRDPATAAPDAGTSVDAAGQKAADDYRPPTRVAAATNVQDVNEATKTLADAQAATATLQPAIGQEGWGERVEQTHVAANQGVINNLQDYLTYAGEETRTTTDFQARYIKTTQQFERLSGMVQQYSATAGADVGDPAALVGTETGGTAEAAGSAVNNAAKAKGGEDLRTTRNRVKDLRRQASELKDAINTADHSILSRKKEVIIAAAAAEKTAADREKDPKEPDSAAVAEVKASMADVKKYMSVGIEAGKAAIPFDALGKVGGKAAEKAADIVIDKVVDAALEEIYRSELEKAKAVQTKASSVSKHASDSINIANVQKGANDLVTSLETQRAKAGEFDLLMADMRAAIREMGQSADNTIKTGGYAVMAQFLSESEVYMNDVDVALSAGKVQKTAADEATGAHRPLDVHKDVQKDETLIYYSASKVGDKFEIIPHSIHINRSGERSAAGDQGSGKTVELMVKDLEADKKTVAEYQTKLNKAFGL